MMARKALQKVWRWPQKGTWRGERPQKGSEEDVWGRESKDYFEKQFEDVSKNY